jgi:4a-hydroxytetrahydrobiopterin dehydratase
MEALETFSALSEKDCIPCKGGVPPLKGPALRELAARLGRGWEVVDEHHLSKEYAFKDFKRALEFTNAVGGLAEAQNHHPEILLAYGKVGITLWTHTINGLTESDFVFAAKVESLPKPD